MNQATQPVTRPATLPLALPWRYSRTAVVLHWVVALGLVGMVGMGWYMVSVEDEPGSAVYFELHKSVGLLMAALIAVRLSWRLTHPPAHLPASVPRWQARLAHAAQVLLYVVMVLMVLSGYLGASHSKAGVMLFGLATPQWALPDHDQAEQYFDIHGALAWVLVAVVSLHVLGALKHLLIDRDGTFQRMWFSRR